MKKTKVEKQKNSFWCSLFSMSDQVSSNNRLACLICFRLYYQKNVIVRHSIQLLPFLLTSNFSFFFHSFVLFSCFSTSLCSASQSRSLSSRRNHAWYNNTWVIQHQISIIDITSPVFIWFRAHRFTRLRITYLRLSIVDQVEGDIFHDGDISMTELYAAPTTYWARIPSAPYCVHLRENDLSTLFLWSCKSFRQRVVKDMRSCESGKHCLPRA